MKQFGFDLLFEVQVPRPWSEGKERDKFHEALEQAVFAEQMGFDTVWIVEHHFLQQFAHSSAPEVMLGALSQRTSRHAPRAGRGAAPRRREPPDPCRRTRAAVIDILSNGRLEMGTGRSSSPYQLEAFGTDVATTREQWEESIKLLPRLWTEEDLTYKGEFYQWDDKITVLPRAAATSAPAIVGRVDATRYLPPRRRKGHRSLDERAAARPKVSSLRSTRTVTPSRLRSIRSVISSTTSLHCSL